MHSKSPLSQVDHGVDIIGDEWDDSEEQEDVEKLKDQVTKLTLQHRSK